jgi:hypothetical protein
MTRRTRCEATLAATGDRRTVLDAVAARAA